MFERKYQDCETPWQPTVAPPIKPEAAAEEPEDDESLNRLQRSLLWFAAILIATSIFANITNSFQ